MEFEEASRYFPYVLMGITDFVFDDDEAESVIKEFLGSLDSAKEEGLKQSPVEGETEFVMEDFIGMLESSSDRSRGVVGALEYWFEDRVPQVDHWVTQKKKVSFAETVDIFYYEEEYDNLKKSKKCRKRQ